jgi:tetratricopeptide (TPR) repeat protein
MEGMFDAGGGAAALVLQGERALYGKTPRPAEAARLFEEALKEDHRCRPAKFALKSLLWWRRVLKDGAGGEGGNGPGVGMRIVDQWEGFYRFLDQIGGVDWDALSAIRYWVSARAIEAFAYNELNPAERGDWNIQFKLGLCYKGVGDYERALCFLDAAAGFKRDNIELMFERADVRALAGDGEEARFLFREAFLADPLEANVYSMASALFCKLYRAAGERGCEGGEILEWMPVWGTLLGVFPKKRELNQSVLGKLKAQVFELENALKTEGGPGSRNAKRQLVPRLLNRYFWLVEHYEVCGRQEARRQGGRADEYERLVNDTLLKIQYLDNGEFIYKQFEKLG